MCYWPSEDLKTWNDSRNDCLVNNSQLLVIQDKEEMEFIKQITRGTDVYWIGLSLSSSDNKWMWVTDAQYDENIFDRPKDTQRNSCGTIKDKINSDKCSAELRWICQKEAILL
ncbi:hypothetical protein JD844_013433 [Phrynosoma platyrhinos]|uniref:C-type lectin domain-containing protein n=1 Tax=Phrynosoma platyrhinos TaxID=52577 RepID=A0ABQ7TKT3_PHRPL|nr:hypothetical protein JD844_013433 [Phrynosoma platyrhinos]